MRSAFVGTQAVKQYPWTTPQFTNSTPAKQGSWGSQQLTWQVCRRSSEDVINKVVEGSADEGGVASSALIEHAPEGPQICCTGVCGPILEQLWSHVAWGATLCLYHFVSVSVLHAKAVMLRFMAAALMFLFGHWCCAEWSYALPVVSLVSLVTVDAGNATCIVLVALHMPLHATCAGYASPGHALANVR